MKKFRKGERRGFGEEVKRFEVDREKRSFRRERESSVMSENEMRYGEF